MRFLLNFKSFMKAWRDYPLETNKTLAERYIVQELIGEGSYGLIYKCTDRISGSSVAVKQARPSKGSRAENFLKREADILKTVGHPQIPEYIDLFKDKNGAYLVMSFLHGDTFEDLIFDQGKRLTEEDCVRYTLDLLDLVEHIHQKGLVHLDLRIPNVFIHDGRLYLIDFGLARKIGEPPPRERPPGMGFPFIRSSSGRFKTAEIQTDLFDIGHFMLFLLYSSFEPDDSPSSKANDRIWQEELDLSDELRQILERLLELRKPYAGIHHLKEDLLRLRRLHDEYGESTES
ncbi:protein kinase [Paenibacillus faecis]|uniref:Protein kinase n=1 Tax=Paenibacillus faecis TaxID=862114 RepID=A0A5D0CM00_9BACL|nr:protein kinase [Paenibacillus faecis]TYA10214.1 protein kinase [Paenibacillus faecis]